MSASSLPLYSETSGHGKPLVLLHGWAMNLRVFDELRTRLSAHYAVTAIDLPGHGRSPWPSDWSPRGQLALIGAAVPAGATLVGWSLGGQLALALAAQAPALERLVLIASTPRFVQGDGWPCGLADATLQQFAAALELDADRLIDDFLALQARGSSEAAAVRTALRGALEQHGRAQPAALRAGLQLLAQTDLRAHTRAITIPALLIAGQHDAVVPPTAAQALAALLPRAQLQLLRRCGHAPFLSHPHEVTAALLQFLGSDTNSAAS